MKVTAWALPRDTVVELQCGGGYGKPSERDAEVVRRDVRLGYSSGGKSREIYAQAYV